MTTFLTRAFFTAMLLTGFCTLIGRAQSVPVPANQLVLPGTSFTLNFIWHGDSLNGRWEPHAALLLPVKLPSCPAQFYMQFDTGSPYSLFYRDKVESIRSKYPKAIPLADSNMVIRNCTFKVGGMPVMAKEMTVKQVDNPKKSSAKEKIVIIGTIGADFIDNRVIMIDYPARSIYTGVHYPAKVRLPVSMPAFYYASRSVLLPATIEGKNSVLYFDTGSSAFELITDEKTAQLMAAPNAEPAKYEVPSWNRMLTANVVATDASIVIASQDIKLNKIAWMEGASSAQVEQMMKLGIGGMTGNKLFIKHKLLLDTKNRKFAVIK